MDGDARSKEARAAAAGIRAGVAAHIFEGRGPEAEDLIATAIDAAVQEAVQAISFKDAREVMRQHFIRDTEPSGVLDAYHANVAMLLHDRFGIRGFAKRNEAAAAVMCLLFDLPHADTPAPPAAEWPGPRGQEVSTPLYERPTHAGDCALYLTPERGFCDCRTPAADDTTEAGNG